MYRTMRSFLTAMIFLVVASAEGDDVAPAIAGLFATSDIHTPDVFYEPPVVLTSHAGTLLKSESLMDMAGPDGMRIWRVQYVTTVADGVPAFAMATVFAPEVRAATRQPVIAWAHGTERLLQKCMPSLRPSPGAGIPALMKIAAAGWVVVATDYQFVEKGGPHPYLIGEAQARAVLDAVRAARALPGVSLDERTVVWGHSQGGHVALWTGIIGPRYAPDVRIAGVAAMAPAVDLRRIFEVNAGMEKWIGPYIAASYSRYYPDVTFDAAVLLKAQPFARQIANLCNHGSATDRKRITELAGTLDGRVLATGSNHALAARLAQNAPQLAIAAPVFIAQGMKDVIIPPNITREFAQVRCRAGQRLEYWAFASRDHRGVVSAGSPLEGPLIGWTAARFAGLSPGEGCRFTDENVTFWTGPGSSMRT